MLWLGLVLYGVIKRGKGGWVLTLWLGKLLGGLWGLINPISSVREGTLASAIVRSLGL